MTKWHYKVVGVYTNTVEEKTGETGFFGGQKTEKKTRWFALADGKEVPLDDFLTAAGDEGWELVAAPVHYDLIMPHIGGMPNKQHWYNPGHMLYFKRAGS